MKKLFFILGLIIIVSGCQTKPAPGNNMVNNFESCVNQTGTIMKSNPPKCQYDGITYTQETNPAVTDFQSCSKVAAVMESFPRQCHYNGVTYIENLPDDSIIGKNCQENSDCPLPMSFAVRSNCPYQSYCYNTRCIVACPMWEPSQAENQKISYRVDCQENPDCNCSQWDRENKFECACLDGRCASIVAE